MPSPLGPASPLVEREVKLRLASVETATQVPGAGLGLVDLTEVRRRVAASGALLVHERALEDNLLFDRGNELRQKGIVLRLRHYGAHEEGAVPPATLTFKGPSSFEGDHKIRDEVDLDCASGVAAAAFLEGLGYRSTVRYQKYREVWRLENEQGVVEVCLDETPIGDFVELEFITGKSENRVDPIEEARRALGLEHQAAERLSYAGLYAQYRLLHPQAPADMVFDEGDVES
jgi:predicted adenylyl cyclase CyaB